MARFSVSSDEWVDINTLLSEGVGTYMLITNVSNPTIKFQESLTQPSSVNKDGIPVGTDLSCEISTNASKVWARASNDTGYIEYQTIPNITLFNSSIPQDLYTSTKSGVRRLQVDQSQTGFWDGREFRIFEPIDLSGTGRKVIKIIANTDLILRWQALSAKSGNITMKAYRLGDGGNDTGSWADTIYKLPNNIMAESEPYTPQVSYQTGGNFVPTNVNLYRDKLEVLVANATAQQSTVGTNTAQERGLSVNTYYLVFTGDGVGDFFSIIEERVV